MTKAEYKINRHNARLENALANRTLCKVAFEFIQFNAIKLANKSRTESQRTAYFQRVAFLMDIHRITDPINLAKARALS